MTDRIQAGGLQIAKVLYDLVSKEITPGTNIDADSFWKAFEQIITRLGPKNLELLKQRESIQSRIDTWHKEHKGQPHNHAAYRQFLEEIDYLRPEGEDFSISVTKVDPEIAEVAGPQLVVPVMNARYALNAANARWGSLYDALYGTDAIPRTGDEENTDKLDPGRAAKVVDFAMNFLDESVPLADSSHSSVAQYSVRDQQLVIRLQNGTETSLAHPDKFAGYKGDKEAPNTILMCNNGLHIEVQVDREHQHRQESPRRGKRYRSGIRYNHYPGL